MDVNSRQQKLQEASRKYAEGREEGEREINEVKKLHDETIEVCMKDPQFRQLHSMMLKEEPLDNEIKRLQDALTQQQRKIVDSENQGKEMQINIEEKQNQYSKLEEISKSNEDRKKLMEEKEQKYNEEQRWKNSRQPQIEDGMISQEMAPNENLKGIT